MMGKDYMLAIIIVNYDDNIWTDQNLQLDPDLPSGWRTIQDSSGTYYWHVPSGSTQWHHPRLSGSKQPQHSQQIQSSPASGPAQASPENRLLWTHEEVSMHEPDTKVFSVHSLGWLQVDEEDLSPGRSSLAVSQVIQQLSHCKSPEQTDRTWAQGQEMMLVLKKDNLSLLDPLDHTLLYRQPIINIRVWGVGCNNGRFFAFIAADASVFKCHVFGCDAPAKTIAAALHDTCAKMMSEKKPSRSITMENFSPEHVPRQVLFLEALQQKVQKFVVRYVGNLPVSRAMGMEVLNRAIESIMTATDTEDWDPAVMHVSDSTLSLWKEEDANEPMWECQVRFLTFLGVGQDSHTFAVIADGGSQRFECHVFWCEPDAGVVSEAVQAACMVQYQKCLVAQTPPPRSKSLHETASNVKRSNSMDGAAFAPLMSLYNHDRSSTIGRTTKAGGGVRKGMLAFFETFRNKQGAGS